MKLTVLDLEIEKEEIEIILSHGLEIIGIIIVIGIIFLIYCKIKKASE